MPRTRTTPGIKSFLRWGGLLAATVAIIGGLLGMHILGGAQGTPTASVPMPAAVAASVTADSAPPASRNMPAVASVSGPILPDRQPAPAMCGCLPGCSGSMAMDGVCTPMFAPATLTAPTPVTGMLGYGSWPPASRSDQTDYEHIPNGPSLNQLSISRT